MVKCSDCGRFLSTRAATSGEPCAACGSVRRHVFAFAGVATGTGTAHGAESVTKERDPGYPKGGCSKPARERPVGMSMSDDGIERSRRRDYDRRGGWYEETVLNPDGTIRHHQRERLSAHTGHGSDKQLKGQR